LVPLAASHSACAAPGSRNARFARPARGPQQCDAPASVATHTPNHHPHSHPEEIDRIHVEASLAAPVVAYIRNLGTPHRGLHPHDTQQRTRLHVHAALHEPGPPGHHCQTCSTASLSHSHATPNQRHAAHAVRLLISPGVTMAIHSMCPLAPCPCHSRCLCWSTHMLVQALSCTPS